MDIWQYAVRLFWHERGAARQTCRTAMPCRRMLVELAAPCHWRSCASRCCCMSFCSSIVTLGWVPVDSPAAFNTQHALRKRGLRARPRPAFKPALEPAAQPEALHGPANYLPCLRDRMSTRIRSRTCPCCNTDPLLRPGRAYCARASRGTASGVRVHKAHTVRLGDFPSSLIAAIVHPASAACDTMYASEPSCLACS